MTKTRYTYWLLAAALAFLLAACSGPTEDPQPAANVDLTVTIAGSGSGSVTSDPGGIDCGAAAADCVGQFEAGTSVTLTAVADEGSTFTGWTGACEGASATCTVEVNEATDVTATFDAIDTSAEYTVNVTAPENGTITSADGNINCGGAGTACSFVYTGGSAVELTATPAEGYRFVNWTGGACDGSTSSTCSFTANADADIAANFAEQGDGSFDISSRPLTAESVSWAPATFWNGTDVYQTADLTPVVNEILGRAGWASGNAMAFIIEGPADQQNFAAVGYETGAAPAGVARLVIELDGAAPAIFPILEPLDDAEEFVTASDIRTFAVGTVYNDDDLEMTYDLGNDYNQLVGLRFANVTIPQGATVVNAYIEFTADADAATPYEPVTIYGQNSDNAAQFACDLGCPTP